MHIEIPIEVPEFAELQATFVTAANATYQGLSELAGALQRMQDTSTQRHDALLTAIERIATMAQLTQADIDALTTRLDAIGAEVSTGVDGLRADIEALKAQDVDTTALEARVDSLQAAADSLAALDAENPTATPEPAPEG